MKRIEIFAAGNRTDNAGVARTFSDADLAASAAAYDPALHEAPIVIGHPKTDAPALGWVQRLAASAGRLIATPAQVQPEFAEQVRSGAYKKVSAAFYPPDSPRNPVPGVWYLRHIGFLGAMPPAVKGLRPVEFGEADDAVVIDVEFAETTPGSDPTPAPEPDPTPTPPEQETAVSPEEAAALRAQNDELKKQNDALLAARAEAARSARHAEHVAYAEMLVEAGRLPQAAAPVVAAVLDAIRPAEAEPVEFGEGDDKGPLADKLRALLDELPARVEFSEQATRERAAPGGETDAGDEATYAENADPERVKLDQKIRAYMKDKGVDYATAARAVIK